MRRYAALSLVLSLCLMLIAGCGGGSQKESAPVDEGRGTARFTINWPEPTKLIPVAAQSIRIRILRGTTQVAQQIVARPAPGQPASVVNFTGLQPGPVTAEATAFPTATATGTPQAIGTVAITIIVDRVVQATLTMNATVSTVTVTPAATFVGDGRTLAITGSALNAAGAAVLTAGSTWTWTSSNPGVATINTGANPATLTGLSPGTTVVTGTESESGKSAQTTIVVSPAYTVANLGTLGTGGDASQGYGINNLGQVVGDSVSDGDVHGFRTAANAPIDPRTSDLGLLENFPTDARDINDSGQAVGSSNFGGTGSSSFPERHAYRTAANAPIDNATDDLGTLGGSESFATAINATGYVVGASDTGRGERHAFLFTTPGTSTSNLLDLGTLGGSNSVAYDINDSTQIVGESTTTGGQTHAFLWQGNSMTDLGTLGGTRSVAYGINSAGRIVGESTNAAGQTRAFVRQGTTLTDLGTLGGSTATARAINSAGQIVGQSVPAGTGATARATLWVNGVAVDLNSVIPAGSGWVLTDARAINNQGQITGVGTVGGVTRAFRLNPQ